MEEDIRLVCVDSRQWYSPYLLKSLKSLCPKIVAYIYLPKCKGKIVDRDSANFEEKAYTKSCVWKTYSYPFDIFKKVILDKASLIHIQWELNSFGSFYATGLLPLLLLFLRIGKRKSIVTMHSIIPRYSFGLRLSGFTLPRGSKFLAQCGFIFLFRAVSILSNGVIVHGKSLKYLLCADYKSKPEKVFVIPYGIPTYISDHSSVFANNLPDTSDLVLAIGAVSPRKGLDTLIKAFEQISYDHPSWTLVIAGRVPSYYQYYYNYLKDLGSRLISKNRLIFLGEFKPQDTSELVKKSKIVVFPYTYNFGASSTLTFALQCRKVVVISALNFAKDLLTNNENAILVSPENSELLSIAIERAMIDEPLRKKIQKGIDILLKKSSWDYVALQTLKVYNTVI